MTLDEAIKHCEEVAEEQERKAQKIGNQLIGSAIAKYQNDCFECAADHRQLAEWLKELQELRRQSDSHCLEIELTKAKELLRKAFGALNDGFCHKDCKQCKWDGGKCNIECRFAWKYGDEASTLLNEGGE